MLTSLDRSAQASHIATQSLVTTTTTTLRRLMEDWSPDSPPHRLVKNDTGVIDGIVDLRSVQRLLVAENPIERNRWEDVTVGAIADIVFAIPDDLPTDSEREVSAEELGHSVPIWDSAGCVAIVVDGSTYVRWSRISAAMQQHQFDPVTQLPARLSFDRRLREDINRSARSGESLAVLLIDLDHFKQINDKLGHAAGDAALLMVADSLRAGFRSYDFVARFAGDEFTVICYDCNLPDIGLPIGRLRSELAARLRGNTDPAMQIGFSIGAAVIASPRASCPPELIVKHADACLYQAKRAGRGTSFVIELDAFGRSSAPAYEIR